VTASLNRVPRLDRDQVVRAALLLLDEAGLDGLTLRRLAAELDVKAPALYWHFASKQDLLDHMAHVMTQPWMHTISTTATGRPWEDWLTEVARTYRTLLLSHRDGARLVASTPAAAGQPAAARRLHRRLPASDRLRTPERPAGDRSAPDQPDLHSSGDDH